MKKIVRKISFVFLIAILLVVNYIPQDEKVEAQTLGGLKQELAKKKADLESNKNKQQATKKQINEAKSKAASFSREIDNIHNEIIELEKEIENLNIEIENKGKEIKDIINYYQISNGESAYLEYMFNATDFTDFIYRTAISEELSSYNDRLIDEYSQMIIDNQNKKVELSAKTVALEEKQKELEKQAAVYQQELVGVVKGAITLEEEIKKLQDNIKIYKSYGCTDNQTLSSCISSSSGGGIPSAAGFYRPLSSGTITQNYGSHYGLDIGVSPGKKVYAVADGVVVNIWNKYHCGGNMVWIAHTVNGRKYTSGYYHLSKINVKLNQYVTHNTVIGLSGGNQWTDTYDNCTFGRGHLHLQMATGHYMIDYTFYSSFEARRVNPRNLINFPGGLSSFSGR